MGLQEFDLDVQKKKLSNAVKPQRGESKVCTKVTLVDLGFNALYPS